MLGFHSDGLTEVNLCLLNINPLIISLEWITQQNVILLSPISTYNCPLLEAYKNSICLHIAGLPMQSVPPHGNLGRSNEYRTKMLRQKATLDVCSDFQFFC